MFFKRKISEENLKKGELLFFKHNGDFTQMIEMGDYLTYKKLNIYQEKEDEWYELIVNDLIDKIFKEKKVINVVCLVNQLVFIGKFENKVIQTLINLLNEDYDTYTKLLFLEELNLIKKRIKSNHNANNLESIITKYKNMLLKNKFFVSDDWLQLEHLKDYDFSKENIKNRIMKL